MRVLCVILLGCVLLLPHISSEEGTSDNGSTEEDENEVVSDGKTDYGLIRKEGCEGHDAGDRWASSDHNNCVCGGVDSICYSVDCLSGPEPELDYNGLWKCKIQSDISKRDIADTDVFLAPEDELQILPSLENLLKGNLPRKKRQLKSVLDAVPVVGLVVSTASFIYGIVHGQQTKAQLEEINEQLGQLNSRLEVLEQQVGDLKFGQQWLEAAALYGKDIQKLQFFIDFLENSLTLGDYGQLLPANSSEEWATFVLSLDSEGVAQALFNLHNMMVGTFGIFGRNSLFVLYESQLDRDSNVYWSKVEEFLQFALAIQTAGYACWATALNLKGREGEVPGVQTTARNRFTSQREFLQRFATQWPTGTYGLPMTNTGCPVAAGAIWLQGYRYQDTEDDDSSNEWISGLHFAGDYWENNMEQKFCMKTTNDEEGGGDWPTGNYCIFKRGNCPLGFQWGSIYWDDEDDDNHNSFAGQLPDGHYDKNTLIQYCCRGDGDVNTPIVLPTRKPFYLFRFRGGCQQVAYMSVRQEWFRWDDEDDDNKDAEIGSHPYDDGGDRNHRLYYCYYYYNN